MVRIEGIQEHNDWIDSNDPLYVGPFRAKLRCVVLAA